MDVILGESLSDRILDFSAYKSYMIATVFYHKGSLIKQIFHLLYNTFAH